MRRTVLYAGPSASGLASALFDDAGVQCRAPVRRGDIDRLLAERGAPGAIVVCDGIFQSVPAVSHAELCRALDAGWQVHGVSSIGAIRAWELRGEGMQGWGEVYAMFARFEDFTDDEMCQLHFPEPPYFAVSEPLVNVRFALARHARALGISDDVGAELVERLRALWFGDRTHDRIRELLVRRLGADEAAAQAFLDVLRQSSVKSQDLVRLLAQRPWARS
jgi:hypothetical protein